MTFKITIHLTTWFCHQRKNTALSRLCTSGIGRGWVHNYRLPYTVRSQKRRKILRTSYKPLPKIGQTGFDILTEEKVQGFWIQTATAGIASLTSLSNNRQCPACWDYCTKKPS
ncbi:MAG: hypothetical protein HEQ35_23505 [Gloeotrichia echinulata IR180]